MVAKDFSNVAKDSELWPLYQNVEHIKLDIFSI